MKNLLKARDIYLLSTVVFLGLMGCKSVAETSVIVTPPSQKSIAGYQDKTLQMFQRVCTRQPWKRSLPKEYVNIISDWKSVCAVAQNVALNDSAADRFFAQYFTKAPIAQEGLFTGYFAAEVAISATQDTEYRFPIHAPPDELKSLTRAEIAEQPHHAPILYYAKDLIEIFVLHIQGSGVGILPNKKRVPLGFAAHNNQQYHSIGRYLLRQGIFTKHNISWPAIEDWLRKLSEPKLLSILHKNPRYIYFSQKNQEPTGSLGVPLIAESAIAIDPKFIPLGLPIILDAEPIMSGHNRYQRLLISADTGAAIKGEVRGDVYFGFGNRARTLAGHMKSRGNLTVYIPKMPIN